MEDKNMKKIILLTAVIALGAVSCTKGFADRNTNPEQATQEMKTATTWLPVRPFPR